MRADPAAEHFNYPVAFDVRELVTLDDVMDEMDLGPNGCAAAFSGGMSLSAVRLPALEVAQSGSNWHTGSERAMVVHWPSATSEFAWSRCTHLLLTADINFAVTTARPHHLQVTEVHLIGTTACHANGANIRCTPFRRGLMACMEYLEEELDDWLADQLQVPRSLHALSTGLVSSWVVVTGSIVFPRADELRDEAGGLTAQFEQLASW